MPVATVGLVKYITLYQYLGVSVYADTAGPIRTYTHQHETARATHKN